MSDINEPQNDEYLNEDLEDLDPTIAAETILDEISSPKELEMRADTMLALAKRYYNLSSEDLDDVEEKVQAAGEKDEEFFEEFASFKDLIARYFDNYWAIIIDTEDERCTYSILHSVYKLLYTDVLDTIANYIVGKLKIEELKGDCTFDTLLVELSSDSSDVSFQDRFIDKYLGDPDKFESDEFFNTLLSVDIGNEELIDVAGAIFEYINFENQSFRTRLLREANYESNPATIAAYIKKYFETNHN
jgi:hypothetical protein